MQQQSPTKSIIIKNECSSDNQNKFEAIITLKILANETGKEIWKDVCLTTERDTIGKMVKHVQEKFIPAEYLNKSLKLRNVTIFSERFGLEVSVAVDGLATDGAKYTANFLNSQNLTERAVDQRSSTTSNLQKKSEDQGKSLTDVEKKYKEKMDLFMKTERDLLKANKQKQTALDDLKLAEKNAKEKSEALKEAQNALDKVRDEKKRLQIDVAQLEKSKKDLGNYLKDMREMSAKKTKDLDKLNKDLEKLEKKRKGMLHQMDVYKKELDAELDGMNKLNTTREKTNSEIENLKNEKQKCKTSLESLKKSEEECRKNLEHLQEEEKKFYLMLNELKEHVHIHQTQLQELQGRENEKNLNENFGLVYGQNGNNNFGEVQQNFNEQSEFNCKGGQQQRGDGNEFDKTENSHQFSGTKDKDTYFNENLWKRSASSFVQGKILGQRNVFNNGSESSSVDTFSPEVKRERKGETKKFTIEAQSPPTSSHFNQNSMQNRAVYIESEELGNPGDGELFSYVDNGPIFGHQNNLLSTACWQEQQPTTIIMTGPPQISPNSIQPLNSVLVNSVKDQPIYSFNSSSSSSGQFRRGTTNRICVVNANNNVRTCGKYRNRQLPILHAERNRSRKMRRGERDHKIFPKRFNISPIRGPIPSSSTSGTYGNCPHSVESSIMKRITIEDQPNKCSSSSIHSRLSFDRK